MADKQKISAILSVILTAILALLAIFGYQVVVVNPTLAALTADVGALRAEVLTLRLNVAAGAATPEEPAACPCAPATPE